MTPIKAIRSKCVDCCNGQRTEVKRCPCRDCPLWPYRMGHRPTADAVTHDSAEIGS